MPTSAQVSAAQDQAAVVSKGLQDLQIKVATQEAAQSTQEQHAANAAAQAQQDAQAVTDATTATQSSLTTVQTAQQQLDAAMAALSQ